MSTHFGHISRYKGPNPPRQRQPTMESIGIPFLALRITHKKSDTLVVIRALAPSNKHPAIVLAYQEEIATLRKRPATTCECVGGGRMNAAGGDLDLYDCCTTFGPWGHYLDEIVAAFTAAMERGELITRNIRPYPDYHPSKFAELQKKFNAMHPLAGAQAQENIVLWPPKDNGSKKRKAKRHVTI